MKITYTAPNRSHHYPYAEALNRSGHLHKFVSGFSRFSPRSPLPAIGNKLERKDLFQNLYLGCLKYHLPESITAKVNRLSALHLDNASYRWAKDSDVFIFYRTEGVKSIQRLRRNGRATLCVMEEVNSHVGYAHEILEVEHAKLKLPQPFKRESDFNLRLETYQQADCILCPSEFVKRSFIEKGFPQEKLLKVNFGFPRVTENSRAASESRKDSFRLLYVGQINYRKGLRYAIEAFNELRHPKKEFIIVGAKTDITGLENIRIPDGVTFTGVLKGQQLSDQFSKASVFVLPSLEEGLALVQGEALSHGIPLITTTNTGGEDIITNGLEGFIVKPANVIELADRLQRLADDQGLVRKMSEAALNTATTLGSWDGAVNRLIEQLSTKVAGAH